MPEIISLSKTEAKQFLLNHSQIFNKTNSVTETFDQFGCIQVDPINVVARNHELVLYNRVNNFKVSDLYDELYKNRSLFEYWMQLFSIVRMDDFPYMNLRMNAEEKWKLQYYKEHKDQITAVKTYIQEHGAASAEDLPDIKAGRTYFSWTNASSKTALMEYLWDTGELMIHHRVNNRKYYDLTERVLPKKLQNQKISRRDAQLFFIHRNFDYIGLIRKPFINRVGYAKTLDLSKVFSEEISEGNIIQVAIENVKTKYYINKKHAAILKTQKSTNDFEGTKILAPLDPLVIERAHLTDVFDFHYRWEAYTPARLRKYGFYNMPILHNGEFIGQISMKKDEKLKLVVETLKFEKRQSASVTKEVRKEIKNLETFIRK